MSCNPCNRPSSSVYFKRYIKNQEPSRLTPSYSQASSQSTRRLTSSYGLQFDVRSYLHSSQCHSTEYWPFYSTSMFRIRYQPCCLLILPFIWNLNFQKVPRHLPTLSAMCNIILSTRPDGILIHPRSFLILIAHRTLERFRFREVWTCSCLAPRDVRGFGCRVVYTSEEAQPEVPINEVSSAVNGLERRLIHLQYVVHRLWEFKNSKETPLVSYWVVRPGLGSFGDATIDAPRLSD